jgi:transcription initiation factor TFIIIB Brf1 subunit/transcription initiation factor TFIIB
VSEEPEWGNYKDESGANEPSKARAYNNKDALNPFSNECGTRITKGFKLEYVRDGKKKSVDMSRVHDQRNYSGKQRAYDMVRNYFENTLATKFHPSIIHTAQVLWGEIAKTGKIYRDGVRRGLIICCVYYSCMHHKNMHSPLEICKIFKLENTDEFVKGDKIFVEIFSNNKDWQSLVKKTAYSDCYFSQYCDKLKIEWHLQRKCLILYNYHKKALAQVIPKSAAAGCIFYVLSSEVTAVSKNTIKETLGVSIPTLVKVYEILQKEELKRIKNGIMLDIPKKVQTRSSKYPYDECLIPLGKTKA